MNILEEIQNCTVEWKELGEVVHSIKTGLNPRKFFQLNPTDATNYYITVREISGHKIVPSEKTDLINNEGLMLCQNRSNLESGDVLFTGTGTIGNVAIIEETPTNWNIKEGVYSIKPKKEIICSKFLMYIFESERVKKDIEGRKAGGTVKSVSMTEMKKVKIPVPPIKIQEKIVQILDKMTEYVTELTSELTSRKKQYSFYRDKLLSFEDEVYQVEWKVLKDVATLKNGKDWKALSSGEIPVYGSGGEMGEFVSDYSYDKPTVLIPRKGSISNLFYLEKAFWNVDTIYYTEIDDKQIIPKYFYYFLTTVKLEEMATNPTRPSLTQAILDKIRIPVPSLEIQSRIIQVLDNFNTVCNDLNIGLPKEIELRQKQYEYFRDKLLTFVAEGEYTESRVEEWDNSALIKLLQWVFGPIRVELGSVFEVIAGGDIPKNGISAIETEEYRYPILSNGINEKSLYGWTNQARIKSPSLTVSARGTIGWTSYREKPFFPIVRLLVLTPKINLNLKYAYYFMKSIENNYEIPQSGIPQLTKPMIQSKIITLPPLEEQSSIVSILDNFNTLTDSLSEGLPKEIELRQKQYEYWREQLLNFTRQSL